MTLGKSHIVGKGSAGQRSRFTGLVYVIYGWLAGVGRTYGFVSQTRALAANIEIKKAGFVHVQPSESGSA